MNLPNKITVFRALLIPFFVFFLLAPLDGIIPSIAFNLYSDDKSQIVSSYSLEISRLIAILIFTIASITDWIDGYLARKHNLITDFGKFMDPLADKLLMAAGFIALIELELAPAWMIILIISRELAVTGLRLVASGSGTVISAGKSGKLKTTIQIITIIVVMFNFGTVINNVFLWATTIITLYSGIEYFIKNRKVISFD